LPVLVTLGVTLLRLAGERQGWPSPWFSPVAGGGLAIVGITWLAPLVGAWLGYRLGRAGLDPGSMTRALILPLAGVVVVFLVAAIGVRLEAGHTATGRFAAWGVASVVGTVVALLAWPTLGRVLLAYAFAARLPVVAVMWFAIQRRWGTHYDAPPPGFPSFVPLNRWLWTGVLPQLTIWVAWTVIVGALGGAFGYALAVRRRA
jgi:hypothetical protein